MHTGIQKADLISFCLKWLSLTHKSARGCCCASEAGGAVLHLYEQQVKEGKRNTITRLHLLTAHKALLAVSHRA